MKTIHLADTQVKFPDACLVCLGYGRNQYKLERTFTYGRSSILLSLPIPLCSEHFKQVSTKSRAQILCEKLSLAGGAVFGAAVCAALLWYWSSGGQGALITNLLLALVVGACMGVTTWAIGYFWAAPLFSSPEAKAVLHSIQMSKYDPFRRVLELTFANESAAELTARENLPILILEGQNLRVYRISGLLHDDDIRLLNSIKTQVLLDHKPGEKEAIALLQPVIDRVMVQQGGVDTFYSVDAVEVVEESARG